MTGSPAPPLETSDERRRHQQGGQLRRTWNGAAEAPSLVLHIGKETNLLEQQEEGVLEVDPQAVYLSEADHEALRELIGRASIRKLAAASGVSERMLRYLRDGSRHLSPATAQAILGALGDAQRIVGGGALVGQLQWLPTRSMIQRRVASHSPIVVRKPGAKFRYAVYPVS